MGACMWGERTEGGCREPAGQQTLGEGSKVDARGRSHHWLAGWIFFSLHPMPCTKVFPCLLTILFGPADTGAI